MEHLGEWIGVAYAGRFLVALAFVSALVATVAFWKGNIHFGRRAYLTHATSTLGVIALMFVLFFGHRYEFQYIWKHLNNEMPMRFVLSAFWGGQEGGFLLWMFWHNVLALFILKRADAWQREVMTVLSSIQAFLGVMLLGIYFGDFQLGLDPFLLLREAPNNIGLPWTARADYLTAIPPIHRRPGTEPLVAELLDDHPPTDPVFGVCGVQHPVRVRCGCIVASRFDVMDQARAPLGILCRGDSRCGHLDGRSLGIRGLEFWRVLGMGPCRKLFTRPLDGPCGRGAPVAHQPQPKATDRLVLHSVPLHLVFPACALLHVPDQERRPR